MALTYVVDERALLNPDGTLLKRLSCPLQKRWQELMPSPGRDDVRKCRSCRKNVISLAGKDEAAIVALLSTNKKPCVHIDYAHPAVNVIGDVTAPWDGDRDLVRTCAYRVIKTARSIAAMNAGLSQGLHPLVKKVEANPALRRTCALLQNKVSGEVRRETDFGNPWRQMYDDDGWEVVVADFETNQSRKSRIAAYLVPSDLRTGDRVVLEDLIEELVDVEYSVRSGSFSTRLKSAEAVWNGEDFVLDECYRTSDSVIG